MRMTYLLSLGTALLAVCATTFVIAQPPEKGDRPERKEAGDRPERGERGDRPERKDRGERPPQRGDRGDRPERGDREGGPRPERRGPGGRPGFMRIMPIIIVLDINKDGEISKEEMEKAAESLQKLDKDKNGKLTEDELRPDFGRRDGDRRGDFGRRDGDRPPRRDGDGPPREGDQRGPGRRDGDRGGNRGGDFVERLMKNDKNKDGKLTKDELPERMQSLFDRIDTNKDKEISKEELTRMAEKFNSRNRSGGRNRGERDSGKDRPKRPESEN